MPQPSVSYACGRVGVLRRSVLGPSQLERLMAAHTYEEACRTLSDIGFVGAENADFQAAADQHVRRACVLVNEVTPRPELTDCFLLRYDIHNLKVLLKSRFLGKEPEFLSACGSLPLEALRHAVSEHRYHALPDVLRDALDALEKQLARAFDPMLVDAELDKAMYRLIFDRLKRASCPTARAYFTAKVDMQNLIILLRTRAMQKDFAFFEKLFLPCGSVELKAFGKAADDPERLSRLMKPYGVNAVQTALQCALDPSRLPLMEKAADDYLYSLFRGARYQSTGMDVLLGYLLKAQREATDVRLIMAGKLNGFAQSQLDERVRELDG